MRKRSLIMGLCLCIMISSTGCKGKDRSLKLDEIKNETVLLRVDGSVQSGSCETFDEVYYDKDDLKKFMKTSVEQFNKEQGKDCVKLNTLKFVENGKKQFAKAIVTYDNISCYSKMNNMEAKSYSMEEAKEAGILPDELTFAVDGSRVTKDKVTQNSEYKVLVIQFEGTLIFPDAVKYYKDAMLLAPNEMETTGEEQSVIVYK